jgi:YVTN family beta-propeller protein
MSWTSTFFEGLLAEGRTALSTGDYPAAVRTLAAALAQWRGPALADLADQPFADAEVARLEEARLGALEDCFDAELADGRAAELVPRLEHEIAEHPLRERLVGALMLALYRAGRQSDALAVYRAARRRLIDELGLEPAPAVRELEQRILRQDASLDLPGPGPSSPGLPVAGPGPIRGARRVRWLLASATALALAAAALANGISRGSNPLTAGPDSIGLIDGAQANLTAVVTGVGRPAGIAYGAGAAWVTDSADGMLLRVNQPGQVIDRIPVGRGPAGVAVGDNEVWVANELDGTVSEVNPGAGVPVATIGVGIGPSAITVGDGAVWVGNLTSDTVSRINAATGEVSATIPLSGTPDDLAFGAGSVWVLSQATDQLLGIDPAGNRPTRAVTIAGNPDGLAFGDGEVWIADANGTVSRFDPRTGRVRTIRVAGAAAGLAYASGAVWVADGLTGTVSRIDPRTGATRVIQVGNEPTDIAASGDSVWATVLPSATSHHGGTLTIIGPQALPDHPGLETDPAVAYYLPTWQMLSLTNDGLVGYRKVTGLAGDALVPDLAQALPSPGDGGRSYTFRLRAGLEYSTGALVRPDDFRRAIERVFDVDRRQNPAVPPFYAGLAGAGQCERRPGPCDLSRGIVTDDAAGTVTFNLVTPDPEFLYKLAFSWAYPVPPGTPDHMISATQLPATGPYLTQSLVQGHTWVLVRNPRFRQWSAPAQPAGYPDRIVLRFDVGPGQAVTDVADGRADVLLSPQPGSVSQLAAHYTSQLHSGPLAATIALTLNTRVAPFDKLAARQAVDYAVDRSLVTALNGGPLAVQATCQVLPPTMPGYQPYCPYTIQPSAGGGWTAPDLVLAKQLVRASGTLGDKVTLLYSPAWGPPFPSPATAHYVVSLLDQIGYRASLREASLDAYYNLLGDSRAQVQAGFFVWYADYPAPSDFVDPLLSCQSFLRGTPTNVNTAEFCDPGIDASAAAAIATEPTSPVLAASRWAAVDHRLTDEAPWVSLYYPRDLTVLAARVGNYEYHPYWNLLIDQLWVR